MQFVANPTPKQTPPKHLICQQKYYLICSYEHPRIRSCFILEVASSECPKILYTKVVNKIAYANSADQDQTALIKFYTVSHSTKYFKKQLHKKQNWPKKYGIKCSKFYSGVARRELFLCTARKNLGKLCQKATFTRKNLLPEGANSFFMSSPYGNEAIYFMLMPLINFFFFLMHVTHIICVISTTCMFKGI